MGLVAGQVGLLRGRGAAQPAQHQLQLCHVHAGRELPVSVPDLQPSRARLGGRGAGGLLRTIMSPAPPREPGLPVPRGRPSHPRTLGAPREALLPERPPEDRWSGPDSSFLGPLEPHVQPSGTPSSEQRLSRGREAQRSEVGPGPGLEWSSGATGVPPPVLRGLWGRPCWWPRLAGGGGLSWPELPCSSPPPGLRWVSPTTDTGPWWVWAGAGHVLEGGGRAAGAKEKDGAEVRGPTRNQGAGGHR